MAAPMRVVVGTGLVGIVAYAYRRWRRQMDFTLRYTVAEAAEVYRRKHGRLVFTRMCGALALSTSHADVVKHVMFVKPRNYLLRPGERSGLAAIGMLDKGIIWNQDLAKFHRGRGVFMKLVGKPESLEYVTRMSAEVAREWCARFDGWEGVDMMDAMGALTMRVALKLFFCEVPDNDVKPLRDAIKGYFEAWEYFLVKPWWYSMVEETLRGRGSKTAAARAKVARVNQHVAQLLATARKQNKDCAFLLMTDKFEEEDQRQLAIELLLAMADTSSVTMYYTLVLLANEPRLCAEVREEIHRVCPNGYPSEADCERNLPLLTKVLKESMRVKPVGPMILRTAVEEDCMSVDGASLSVAAGTHFLLNIRDYHMDPEYFPDPQTINPHRFDDPQQDLKLMPFGVGPKSCVGRFFAMREMKGIIVEVLRSLEFWTPDVLMAVDTRWDIANHPTDAQLFHVQGLKRASVAAVCGPASTGKSTLTRRVGALVPVPVQEELARPLIQELGLSQHDFTEFTEAAARFQRELCLRSLQAHAALPLALLDRCAIDPLAHLRWKRPEAYAALLKEVRSRVRDVYGNVRILLLAPELALVDDGVRMLSDQKGRQALWCCYEIVLQDLGLHYERWPFTRDWANASALASALSTI